MAEFESPAEFDDELLSAYLDDELSAAERARVDERLQIDPAAAQLLEELRAVSGAVRSLPREKLSRDLRASVLAGVERDEAEDEPRVVKLPYAGEDRWAGVRRGLVWSALAIAAALLLMFLQPREGEEGAVADRGNRAKQTEERQRTVRSADEVPAFRAPDVSEEGIVDGVGGRAGGVKDSESAQAEAEREEGLRDEPLGSALAVGSGPEEMSEDLADDASDLGKELTAQAAPGAGIEQPAESAVSELDALPASGAPSSAAGESGRVESLAGGAAAKAPAAVAAASEEKRALAEVQVVELDLGDKAADAREFEQVLAENNIALSREALTPEAAEDGAAAESLTAGDSILVEATGEQLKRVLSVYQGRAVAVGHVRLSEDLSSLMRHDARVDVLSATDMKALADWASRAADKAKKNVRGGGGPDGSGEAWRLLSADAQARRAVEAPVRVAPDSPASTSSASSPASSPRSYDAAPAADSRRAAALGGELDRLKARRDAEQGPRIRVLFRFRPVVPAAPAAPAEE